MSGRAWGALRAVGGRSSCGRLASLARSEFAPAQESVSTVTWAGPEPRALGGVAGQRAFLRPLSPPPALGAASALPSRSHHQPPSHLQGRQTQRRAGDFKADVHCWQVSVGAAYWWRLRSWAERQYTRTGSAVLLGGGERGASRGRAPRRLLPRSTPLVLR